jgi:hypothetical protein
MRAARESGIALSIQYFIAIQSSNAWQRRWQLTELRNENCALVSKIRFQKNDWVRPNNPSDHKPGCSPKENLLFPAQSGKRRIDFNERILEINLQRLPLLQGIMDGFAHSTLRQEASGNEPALEDPMDSCADGPALTGAISITQRPARSTPDRLSLPGTRSR